MGLKRGEGAWLARDGLRRQHEVFGDVVGARAAGEQIQDLPLAVGQARAHRAQTGPAAGGGAEALDQLHGELA